MMASPKRGNGSLPLIRDGNTQGVSERYPSDLNQNEPTTVYIDLSNLFSLVLQTQLPLA